MNPRKVNQGSSSAGECVQLHLCVLRAVGFCRLAPPPLPSPAVPRTLRRRLHAAYHVFTLCAISTYAMQQLIYAYQVGPQSPVPHRFERSLRLKSSR